MNYDLLWMIMMFSYPTINITISKDLVTTLVEGPHTWWSHW